MGHKHAAYVWVHLKEEGISLPKNSLELVVAFCQVFSFLLLLSMPHFTLIILLQDTSTFYNTDCII